VLRFSAMSDLEIVKEFLVESYENLDRLDRDLIALEKDPATRRSWPACSHHSHHQRNLGLSGVSPVGAVTHVGENLLARLRDGLLTLNARSRPPCWPWWMRCGRCWEASKRRASRGTQRSGTDRAPDAAAAAEGGSGPGSSRRGARPAGSPAHRSAAAAPNVGDILIKGAQRSERSV